MYIFVLFVSAGVLFGGSFSLWVSLRISVSSLTEIHYLQIEPTEKGTYTNESIIPKMCYLYGFFRWTISIWWAIENNYLHVYEHFEFQVEWIRAIRNTAKIIFSSKNHYSSQLASIFVWNPHRKRKKVTNYYM